MKRVEPEHWEKHLAKLPLRQGGFSQELMQKVKDRVEAGPPQRRQSRWLWWSPAAALVVAAAIGVATQTDALTDAVSKLSKVRQPASLEAMDPDKKITLKVGNIDDISFASRYGTAFMARYPNITLQTDAPGGLALWSSKARVELEEWLAQEKPDVLILTPDQYERLAKSGKLYALDNAIKQDGFDLQNIHAGVVEQLRSPGGGTLYGLSPQYEQLALYYNKNMFDRYNVSYPKNGMSWDELLKLAGAFAAHGKAKEKLYGLTVPAGMSPFELVQMAGKARGLRLTDADGRRATIDTPQWKQLWGQALEAYRNGVIYQPPSATSSTAAAEVARSNPFISGQAAMTLQSFSFTHELTEARQQHTLPWFTWQTVTEPTDPGKPGRSASFSLGAVYAVNADSSQLRAAWELVKFVNSEESARTALSASPSGFNPSRLPSVTSSGLTGTGKGLEAFYMLLPAETSRSVTEPPASFYRDVEQLALQQSEAVLSGKKTLDAALQELQVQGQQALTQGRNDMSKR
ncbi:ABC transporter substrate-binding protein [Paenibacillus allorhizosphaerae]|uniref:Extracellular solute-binding protein n=1 Tax=Paenibacillus allorhizosphaerae TaxID=2849866 RepID=A0ABM8VJI8_9BACL|nr:extracellular solute-binding protein [Paenibacillus allorhizosphaerae]CAG7645591.1 hypothetical protein PAECIP111802_03554 [Paenibacillus allorhizosphaerae]